MYVIDPRNNFAEQFASPVRSTYVLVLKLLWHALGSTHRAAVVALWGRVRRLSLLLVAR